MSSRKRKAGFSSTSRSVHMTVIDDDGDVTTTNSTLADLHNDRLAEEQAKKRKTAEVSKAVARLLADSAIEAGADIDKLLNEVRGFATDDRPILGVEDRDEDYVDEEEEPTADDLRDGDMWTTAQLAALTSSRSWKNTRRRHDQRTRLDRNRASEHAWQAQIADLTMAYLQWKHLPPPDDVDQNVYMFEVTAVHTHEYVPVCRIPQENNQEGNVALVRRGLLGCTPTQPRLAIGLRCLEFYHQLRRRQSSLSVQAMVKTLCSVHNVTYTQHLRDQFSATFDVYLEILRRVRTATDQALGRGSPDWRQKFGCPPCGNKQPNEPVLVPARLHAMDGNNSLKRVEGSGHSDEREFPSAYLIPPAEVNQYENEVQARSRTVGPAVHATDEDAQDSAECTKRWKAANAGSEGSVRVFEQTGIFLCACRHGLVEFVAEMRHSGEQAKYPLATAARIMKIYGKDQGVGHDIACSFTATIGNSSLGSQARDLGLILAVNAFHGHAHNRLCQLRFHPLFLKFLGLEDLETCERVFSASNAVARTIRFASHFHWLQYIDLHFDQWDRDRYLELSRFLYNNYRQALSIIAEYTPIVEDYKAANKLCDENFESWRSDELAYLQRLVKEPEEDVSKVAYFEALEGLKIAQDAWTKVSTTTQFLNLHQNTFNVREQRDQNQALARAKVAQTTKAKNRLDVATQAVEAIEHALGIEERWLPDSSEYIATQLYVKNRRFIRAVDELERLVVQRLFELSKANLAGTGYKLRRQISKHLVRRSEAIRTALNKYNELAPLQEPPRRTLAYNDVMAYGWLGEFELLRHSSHALLEKPWSSPVARDVMVKYFKLRCAHAEIHRLNVEIPRLQQWLEDEDLSFDQAASKLDSSSALLAAELRAQHRVQKRINNVHRAWLARIYVLPGYTGPRPAALHTDGDGLASEEVEVLPDEDDHANDEACRLEETVARMSL